MLRVRDFSPRIKIAVAWLNSARWEKSLMYAEKIRQLASVFVDAESIQANPRDVAELSKELKDDRFFPILVIEPGPGGRAARIGFQSAGGEWLFSLLGKRIDFVRRPTAPGGSNIGDFGEFCREAVPKFIIALNFFQRKAHRLAAVQEGILPKMKPKEMDKLARRLLKLPPTFSETMPFEWDWRSVSLINRSFARLEEPTNTIVIVKRESGVVIGQTEKKPTHKPFDQIRVDFDINTSAKNVKARFGDDEITSFFEGCPAWHASLMAEISGFLKERIANE
jgi:hypothetical protein